MSLKLSYVYHEWDTKPREQTEGCRWQGEQQSRDVDGMAVLGRWKLGLRISQVGMALKNRTGIQLNPRRATPQE